MTSVFGPILKISFAARGQVVLAGQLARLVVVDHEDLNVLERFFQFGGSSLDPVVHGVQADELRLAL